MESDNRNEALDELIRTSFQLTDTPSPQLDARLREALYRQEKEKTGQAASRRSISLWYVPMLLNFTIFSLLAVLSFPILPNLYLAGLTALVCMYAGFAGFIITFVGIKRTNLKQSFTIYIEKRGAFI